LVVESQVSPLGHDDESVGSQGSGTDELHWPDPSHAQWSGQSLSSVHDKSSHVPSTQYNPSAQWLVLMHSTQQFDTQ
jgi:hypothetical protein